MGKQHERMRSIQQQDNMLQSGSGARTLPLCVQQLSTCKRKSRARSTSSRQMQWLKLTAYRAPSHGPHVRSQGTWLSTNGPWVNRHTGKLLEASPTLSPPGTDAQIVGDLASPSLAWNPRDPRSGD